MPTAAGLVSRRERPDPWVLDIQALPWVFSVMVVFGVFICF